MLRTVLLIIHIILQLFESALIMAHHIRTKIVLKHIGRYWIDICIFKHFIKK